MPVNQARSPVKVASSPVGPTATIGNPPLGPYVAATFSSPHRRGSNTSVNSSSSSSCGHTTNSACSSPGNDEKTSWKVGCNDPTMEISNNAIENFPVREEILFPSSKRTSSTDSSGRSSLSHMIDSYSARSMLNEQVMEVIEKQRKSSSSSILDYNNNTVASRLQSIHTSTIVPTTSSSCKSSVKSEGIFDFFLDLDDFSSSLNRSRSNTIGQDESYYHPDGGAVLGNHGHHPLHITSHVHPVTGDSRLRSRTLSAGGVLNDSKNGIRREESILMFDLDLE